MFAISVKRVDDRQVRQVFRVSADTLDEAERYVVTVLQEQYDTRSIVLMHVGELVYHVYDIDGFVGVVQIRFEG